MTCQTCGLEITPTEEKFCTEHNLPSIRYRVTYWPGSWSREHDWHLNPNIVSMLEKVHNFNADSDEIAKKVADHYFFMFGSDGVLLERYTMDSDANWFWSCPFKEKYL